MRAFSADAGSEAEVSLQFLDQHHEGVAIIKMNRPAKKNAIGSVFLSQLDDCLAACRSERALRCVILKSEVPGVFCAGADLKERAKMSPAEAGAFVTKLRRVFSDLESLPIPTVACIDGAALGGGAELSLACDTRIVSKGAKFALPETGLAIIPGAGGTQRLPRVVGASLAKELIFSGQVLSASQVVKLQLASQLYDASSADESLSTALEFAKKLVTKGPIALRLAKQAVTLGMQMDVNSGMAVEGACYAQVLHTRDRLEGLQAFGEKRKPEYTGE